MYKRFDLEPKERLKIQFRIKVDVTHKYLMIHFLIKLFSLSNIRKTVKMIFNHPNWDKETHHKFTCEQPEPRVRPVTAADNQSAPSTLISKCSVEVLLTGSVLSASLWPSSETIKIWFVFDGSRRRSVVESLTETRSQLYLFCFYFSSVVTFVIKPSWSWCEIKTSPQKHHRCSHTLTSVFWMFFRVFLPQTGD